MKIVREHINEKFSEKSDPVQDMGIGFVKYVSKALTNIINDHVMSDYLGSSIITDFSFSDGKLTVYCRYGLPDNTPYIRDVFERHGLADYVIFNPPGRYTAPGFYFRLDIKPKYREVFKEAVSLRGNRKVNEKFTEKSDPIKDMSIGSPKFFKMEYKKLILFEYDQIQKYFGFQKYKFSNEDEEFLISLICVEMLDHLGNNETVPNAFQDSYNYWRKHTSEHGKASSIMNMCRQILLDKYGLQWH